MKSHFFILAIGAFIMYGCINSNHKHNKVQNEMIAGIIVGKTIPIIDSLYQDNQGERYLVLLCSPYDCAPCLDKAFETLNIIDGSGIRNRRWVVSVLDEPSSLHRQYNYLDYILFDGNDMIRKTLKYILTPVFLIINADNVVESYHFPTQEDDTYKTSELIINNLISPNYETD